MLNWAVTGGSGFIGAALLDGLDKRCADSDLLDNVKLLSICRRTPNKTSPRIEYIEVGDFVANVDNICWGRYFDSIDVVVHALGRAHILRDKSKNPLDEFRRINVIATLNFARKVAASGVKRFIFLSSIGVNGKSTPTGFSFDESSNTFPHNEYAQSKYEAEMGLYKISKETGLEVVIIRPPLVYGFNAPGNFGTLMSAVKKGMPLPLGSVHNKRSLVFLGNLVDFIIVCGSDLRAANQTFLISDGQDLSTTEFIKKLIHATGAPNRLLSLNSSLLRFAVNLIGRSEVLEKLCGNLQVDISKARNLLDWVPPYSIDEGIQIAVQGCKN